MPPPARPHILGVDDGPFDKHRDAATPLVGVTMEGRDRVEAVAITSFPVDGADVTDFLADWVRGLRVHPTLQALALGGITLAGLAVVDATRLAAALELPVLVVSRKDPAASRVASALHAADLPERVAILQRAPAAVRVAPGVHLAWAGTTEADARALLEASRDKGTLPEAVRVAHLIAAAAVQGSSRGRA